MKRLELKFGNAEDRHRTWKADAVLIGFCVLWVLTTLVLFLVTVATGGSVFTAISFLVNALTFTLIAVPPILRFREHRLRREVAEAQQREDS